MYTRTVRLYPNFTFDVVDFDDYEFIIYSESKFKYFIKPINDSQNDTKEQNEFSVSEYLQQLFDIRNIYKKTNLKLCDFPNKWPETDIEKVAAAIIKFYKNYAPLSILDALISKYKDINISLTNDISTLQVPNFLTTIFKNGALIQKFDTDLDLTLDLDEIRNLFYPTLTKIDMHYVLYDDHKYLEAKHESIYLILLAIEALYSEHVLFNKVHKDMDPPEFAYLNKKGTIPNVTLKIVDNDEDIQGETFKIDYCFSSNFDALRFIICSTSALKNHYISECKICKRLIVSNRRDTTLCPSIEGSGKSKCARKVYNEKYYDPIRKKAKK